MCGRPARIGINPRAATRIAWTLVVVIVACVGVWADEPGHERATVTITRIDGSNLSGEWLGSVDGGSVRVRTDAGDVELLIDDLTRLVFRVSRPTKTKHCETAISPNPSLARRGATDGVRQSTGAGEMEILEQSASQATRAVTFHLADGSRLPGELVGGDDAGVLTRTVLGDGVRIAWSQLAAVERGVSNVNPRTEVNSREMANSNADALLREVLGDRLVAQDTLITRDAEGAKTLRGRLTSLDVHGGAFEFAGRRRTFAWDKVHAVVFAAGATSGVASLRHIATVTLHDGSTLRCRLVSATESILTAATSVGIETVQPLSGVSRVDFASDRVTYVSDLTPVEEHVEGRLHRPWPVRFDASVSGGALSVGSRAFTRGIGCHAVTVLSYELGGPYETFAATIGIDDLVRPRGSVVFRMIGDGRTLFNSGTVTGRDDPQDIVVDVTGVDRLTLTVDDADGIDLSDHADWGDARLIRSVTASSPPNQPAEFEGSRVESPGD